MFFPNLESLQNRTCSRYETNNDKIIQNTRKREEEEEEKKEYYLYCKNANCEKEEKNTVIVAHSNDL